MDYQFKKSKNLINLANPTNKLEYDDFMLTKPESKTISIGLLNKLSNLFLLLFMTEDILQLFFQHKLDFNYFTAIFVK